jgi:hypothetical protein
MNLFFPRAVFAHFLVGQIKDGGVLELNFRSQADPAQAGTTPAPTPDPDPMGAKKALNDKFAAAIKRRDAKLLPKKHEYNPRDCVNGGNRFEEGATAREKALHCFQPKEFMNGELFGVETARCDTTAQQEGLKQCMTQAASQGIQWLACKGIAKTIPSDELLVNTVVQVKKKWAVEKFGHFLAAAFFNCPACDCFRKFFDGVRNICKVGYHRVDWCEALDVADADMKESQLKQSVFDVCGTDVFCGNRLAVPMNVP